MPKACIVFAFFSLFMLACEGPGPNAPFQDHLNVVWDTQSENSEGSMPFIKQSLIFFDQHYRARQKLRKGMELDQEGIFFARMGKTKEAANYYTRKLQDSPRRFPTFWDPGHDWVPDHNWGGSGMIGLQEMLMQTIGEQIVMLPAWPKNWEVHIKLHAPRNTTVECRFEEGEITLLRVLPESRTDDVQVLVSKSQLDDS